MYVLSHIIFKTTSYKFNNVGPWIENDIFHVPFSWHAVWGNASPSKLRYFARFSSLFFLMPRYYYKSSVYWLGILCVGNIPENCIEHCIAVLWQKSGDLLFCHLAFDLLKLSIPGSWRCLRSACQPCNEYPLGPGLGLWACAQGCIKHGCMDGEGQLNEGPGRELSSTLLSQLYLAVHAQGAELRFLLSGKGIIQRAVSWNPCINPPVWTSAQSTEMTLVRCDPSSFAVIIFGLSCFKRLPVATLFS